ncbi:MAG: DUF1801 domain-containing protein [Candidatus Poseidoniales archaeon]|nr:MAG: DUF1801 domain-containing protein [Candidatus Poseidoniales archaeon]
MASSRNTQTEWPQDKPMVQSKAAHPAQYLAELDEKRRGPMTELFERISLAMPDWTPVMAYGMLSWSAPHPEDGEEPLIPVSLASQKRHMSLYFMPMYIDERVKTAVNAAYEVMGVKPNMGKSCLRFTRIDRMPLPTVLEVLRACTPATYLAQSRWAQDNMRCD